MDLRSIETNKYVEWDTSIEDILSELGDEAQINAYLHKMANIHFTNKNIKFQLPIIILSALSGTGNFISNNFPDYQQIIILAIGGISIFTSIISSVAQFLKVSQLSENHRISYLAWEKFYSTIKFQVRQRRESRDNLRDFISIVIPEYQRLKEISADIPKHICEKVKKRKKNLHKMQVPYLINGFHPVIPYKEKETDDDTDDNDNEIINIDSLNIYNNDNENYDDNINNTNV
jgi:hypothetical protein